MQTLRERCVRACSVSFSSLCTIVDLVSRLLFQRDCGRLLPAVRPGTIDAAAACVAALRVLTARPGLLLRAQGLIAPARNMTECQRCDVGTYAPTSAVSAGGCVFGVKRLSDPPAFPVQLSVCSTCTAGKFASSAGSAKCEECPLGTYNTQGQRSSCDPCEAGEGERTALPGRQSAQPRSCSLRVCRALPATDWQDRLVSALPLLVSGDSHEIVPSARLAPRAPPTPSWARASARSAAAATSQRWTKALPGEFCLCAALPRGVC